MINHIDHMVLTCTHKGCGKIIGMIETPAQVVGLGNAAFDPNYIIATCLEHGVDVIARSPSAYWLNPEHKD